MSNVPASKRKQQPLLAYVKGAEIRDKVFNIVENEKYVPKRHRILYGNTMYTHACNIVYNVINANAAYPKSYSAFYMRRWYQQQAIMSCAMLYEDIKTLISRCTNKSMTKGLIVLSNDISSELGLIRNWRKSTKLLKGSPGNSTGSNKNLNAISAVGNKIIKKKAAKINASSNNGCSANNISTAGNISTSEPNIGGIGNTAVSGSEFVDNILKNQMNSLSNNDSNNNANSFVVSNPNESTNSTIIVSGFEVNNPNAVSGPNSTDNNNSTIGNSAVSVNNCVSNGDGFTDEDDAERMTAASAILMDLMDSSFDGDVFF